MQVRVIWRQMSFRAVGILSDELGERLEQQAKVERRSLSQMVALLIERGLDGKATTTREASSEPLSSVER